MCHRGERLTMMSKQYPGEHLLLKSEFLKTNDMVENKKLIMNFQNRFLQLETNIGSFPLEISMQQKGRKFQSNKPCKNQDAPEFCEFFEINDLKAQLQAKTTLICNLKNQIKSVKEASNEAKTKDHNDSLIDQVNSKTVENADLKAQIQEKVNSRAKVQSPKIKNNNPVEPKNHTHKPGKRNGIGQRFSLNKSSAVHEKPHTPRSYLRYICQSFKGKTQSLVTKKTDISYVRSSRNSNLMNMLQKMFGQNSSDLVLHLDDVWTKQFKPRSSSKDVWTKQFKPRSSS
ncbi:hypothetical protein Tco_0091931 [Tanacetum coccineum]